MELCDLYDENRRPLGRVYERGTPLGAGEYLLAVGVWLINSKGEILLTRRSPEKKFAPNLWENTGGHAMAGERSPDAAARELFEETGVLAKPEELIFIGSSKNPPYFGDDYALRRDVEITDIRLQEGETCEARWVTLQTFDQMIQSGEVAPSVASHLAPLRADFDRILNPPPAKDPVRQIGDPEQKRHIASFLLQRLPQWFGNPDATEAYIRESGELPVFAKLDGTVPVGFLAVKKTSPQAAAIHVMGVAPAYRRSGVGRALMTACLDWCRQNGILYLQVKTLDESCPYPWYAQTRAFYRAMGFCPLECFPTFWDRDNPCLIMVRKVD